MYLRGPSWQTLASYGLVDSGADRCYFPHAYLTPLGIRETDCTPTRVKGSTGDAMHLRLDGHVNLTLSGCSIRVDGPVFGALPVVLLGRAGFFDKFRVSFDERAKLFWLEAYE